MTSAVPTWDPDREGQWHPSKYWDDLRAQGLLPDEPTGERLPDAVMVPGAIVTPPKQARTYIGPGVQRELDRARAFEVIALAAIDFIDNGGSDIWCEQGQGLKEAIAENRAAVQTDA